VGQIHGWPTRSKFWVGHGPHGPPGSGAYVKSNMSAHVIYYSVRSHVISLNFGKYQICDDISETVHDRDT